MVAQNVMCKWGVKVVQSDITFRQDLFQSTHVRIMLRATIGTIINLPSLFCGCVFFHIELITTCANLDLNCDGLLILD